MMTRPNPGFRHLPFAPGPRPIRHVDLFECLVWVIRDQMAGYSLSMVANADTSGAGGGWRDIVDLGTTIDVSPRVGSDRLHPDAEAIADWLSQHLDMLHVLWRPAREGVPPKAIVETPRPHFIKGDRRRDGHVARVKDGRTDQCVCIKLARNHDVGRDGFYRITTTKRVFGGPKGKSRLVTESKDVPVLYCPIRWTPDPDHVDESLRRYRRWRWAMQALLDDLPTLRSHVVTGIRQPPL